MVLAAGSGARVSINAAVPVYRVGVVVRQCGAQQPTADAAAAAYLALTDLCAGTYGTGGVFGVVRIMHVQKATAGGPANRGVDRRSIGRAAVRGCARGARIAVGRIYFVCVLSNQSSS